MIKFPTKEEIKNSLVSKWRGTLSTDQISDAKLDIFCEEQAEKTNKDFIWYMPYIPFDRKVFNEL